MSQRKVFYLFSDYKQKKSFCFLYDITDYSVIDIGINF